MDRVLPLLPDEPAVLAIHIHEILVRTKLSQKNALGAARQTIPFDRINENKTVRGLRLFCVVCKSICQRAIYQAPFCQQDGAWALFCQHL
jgi:hypothetical protein